MAWWARERGFAGVAFATAIVAAGLCTFVPSRADACSPVGCVFSGQWIDLRVGWTQVSDLGMITIVGERGVWASIPAAESWAFVQVEVTNADGEIVEGVQSYGPDFDVLVWTPLDSWASAGGPGEYQVRIVADNAGISDEECSSDLEIVQSVTVGEIEPVGLELDPLIEESLEILPEVQLDDLVCCDGAMPRIDGSCATSADWQEGHCVATRGIGELVASLSFVAGPGASYVGTFVTDDGTYRALPPGTSTLELRTTSAFCGHFEVMLDSGIVGIGSEVCVGEKLAAQLGEQVFDPGPELARQCNGEPYVCEHDNWQWDPDACVPYGGESSETGGSGANDDAADATGGSSTNGGGAADVGGDQEMDATTSEDGTDGPGQGDIADRGCACSVRSRSRGGFISLSLGLVVLALRRRRFRARRG